MKSILSLLFVFALILVSGCQKSTNNQEKEEELKAGAGQKRSAVERVVDFRRI